MPYIIFVLKISTFCGFYVWPLIGVKGETRFAQSLTRPEVDLQGDYITLTYQRAFLSFNNNQKPRIKSPKSGNFANKNYSYRAFNRPFSSHPNIKEEKAVWLHDTKVAFYSRSYINVGQHPRSELPLWQRYYAINHLAFLQKLL